MTQSELAADQANIGTQAGEEEEISLLDLAIVLAKRKKMIMGVASVAAVLSLAVSLVLPNIYTASTKVLPPQQSQSSASAMLAQLGGLASLAGGAAGLKNPADLYIGMLKSRSVADKLIQRFGLDAVYDSKFPSDTRKHLESVSNISAGKDGILAIEVDDKDPKRAAALANGYVEELYAMTKGLAITEASQRRLFFENQLQQAKDNLTHAEIQAKSAIDQGGLVNMESQGRGMVETTARLRAQIAVKEVQISSMRTFAAERNPQLLAAQQELAALKAELGKTEGTGSGKLPADGTASSERGLNNLALLRNVKYFETVFELMAKQYEMAKIDEAKDPTLIQVIDKAIEPDRKSKPKRALIVILSTLAAGFLAVIWAFVQESMEKSREDAASAERMALFRKSLRWRQ